MCTIPWSHRRTTWMLVLKHVTTQKSNHGGIFMSTAAEEGHDIWSYLRRDSYSYCQEVVRHTPGAISTCACISNKHLTCCAILGVILALVTHINSPTIFPKCPTRNTSTAIRGSNQTLDYLKLTPEVQFYAMNDFHHYGNLFSKKEHSDK